MSVFRAESLAQLRTQVPDCKWLERIEELDRFASELPLETFREPVAINEIDEKGNNRLFNCDAAYVIAWTCHMSYSMRLRLRSLEPSIVDNLAGGSALAAQVLLRSHLESSAMAALCLDKLMKRATDELSLLIPKTLFGTALYSRAKQDERVEDMLTFSEGRTILITEAMKALHNFAYPENTTDNISIAYSLLCEASHPNHRDTRLFVDTEEIDEHVQYGWYVTYRKSENVPPHLVNRLLETLLVSMRCGYAATELLRNIEVQDGAGGLEIRGVRPDVGHRIWSDLLQNEVPDEEK